MISRRRFYSLLRLLLTVLIIVCYSACASAVKISPFDGNVRAGKVVISRTVDLQGKTVTLPEGCTLVFKKKGIITNGTIVGANTRIKYKKHCFDNVKIKGSWLVSEIRSEMFRSYDKSSLIDLFALQNSSISNKIYVASGVYNVSANEQRGALSLTSNTKLRLDGEIRLQPQYNNKFYNGYYIISVSRAENVEITGKGTIRGDWGSSGLTSEFGHGICVFGSKNVAISGLTIKDVQGDGIAISIGSSKVSVNGVIIEHYCRNGISIVDGSDYTINNVTVRNGGETSPFAAIDIEPNEGYHINNVQIKNMIIENCTVGVSGCLSKNASVDNVRYNGLRITGATKCCLTSSAFSNLEFEDVYIGKVGENAEIMRFIGNQSLSLKKVVVEAGNNKAKYPFYLDNGRLKVESCRFECPQLFSWHLKDAQFVNSTFKFDSFIWTALDLDNRNMTFDNCVFDGPLYMRPNNVSFSNSTFRNSHAQRKYLVKFEDSRKTKGEYTGVVMDNNTFETNDDMTESNAVQCLTKKSEVRRTKFKRQ